MITLDTRYTYKDIVNMGTSVSPSRGKVVLNIDEKPVLFKFPYQEESFLIFGYNPNTGELCLAETHYTSRNEIKKWNVEEVKARLYHLGTHNIEFEVTADNAKNNFIQEFLFSQGYQWANSGKRVISDLPKGSKLLAKMFTKMITYYQPDFNISDPEGTLKLTYTAFFQSYLTYDPIFTKPIFTNPTDDRT